MKKSFLISMMALTLITIGCGSGNPGAISASTSAPGSGSSPTPSPSPNPAPSVSTAFTAGVSHIDGKYRFTQNNYLVEGAQKISDLGSTSIFVYLTPWFRREYPDESSTKWPASDPLGLEGLGPTAAYAT